MIVIPAYGTRDTDSTLIPILAIGIDTDISVEHLLNYTTTGVTHQSKSLTVQQQFWGGSREPRDFRY